MTVTDLAVDALDLAMTAPFEIATGTQHAAANVLVTVTLDDGTEGYGEGAPATSVTGETQAATMETVRAAAPLVEGRDESTYRALVEDVRSTFPNQPAATLAVETALLDAYCRARDLPLAALFGGRPHPIETDFTIPILDADAARERATTAAAEGYTTLKVKTGTTVARDVERVEAVHDAAPDATLTVDANQGWSPAEAVRFADTVSDAGITLSLLEQPVAAADLTGMAHVRDRVTVPVGADESVFTPTDAIRVIRADAADVLNVKLGKAGLLGGHAIAEIAHAANRDVMVGCMVESSLGTHAAAHLVGGSGRFSHVDLDSNRLLAEDVTPLERGPTIEPAGPGHGIDH